MSSDFLDQLSDKVQTKFQESNTILSYSEWFDQVLEHPQRNLRSASQYIQDVFDYYGTTQVDRPQGPLERFNMFDAPWQGGHGRVAGQECVQQEIYRLISNFVKDGRVSKLILLHGPNGSAKSTIVRCIQSAMENYSQTTEGAIYTYAWIFPSEKLTKTSLGFGKGSSAAGNRESKDGSYAHVDAEQIDARLPCELREHPIFFFPHAERMQLFERLIEEEKLPPDFIVSRYMIEGDLSPRDRAIYDGLLVAYDGNHAEVLKHVQVQRFTMSVKYRHGVATIEPQMAVDALSQQLTTDRSIANLPRTLQHIPLHQIGGPLVSANRGLLEFSDFLKRPLEALKYLLTTSEEATASLPDFKLQIDELLLASTNEAYLEAFKKNPDWNSFKGRIELVSVPYLRRHQDEIEIYKQQITHEKIDKPMAPHVVEVAAMWAVLTRLRKPKADRNMYESSVRDIVRKLSPLDKLRLYDNGETPKWCTTKESRELIYAVPALYDETKNKLDYEGNRGASAREIRTLILNAAHIPDLRTLTPQAILIELENLIRDKSVYGYLQDEIQDGFHAHEGFITIVRDYWLDKLDEELKTSMGLVEEHRYLDLFSRYVQHVSQHIKKEKILDQVTGDYIDPDQQLMVEVESSIIPKEENKDDFRRSIIGQIGAWSLENQGKAPDYKVLFAHFIEQMEEGFYAERQRLIERNLELVVQCCNGNGSDLPDEEREAAQDTIDSMEKRFGYPPDCTGECAAYILKQRYRERPSD
jgi:serine protein kinase